MLRRLTLVSLMLALPSLAAAQHDPRYPRSAGSRAVGPTFSAWLGVGAPGGRFSDEGNAELGDFIERQIAFGLAAGYRFSPMFRGAVTLEALPLSMHAGASSGSDVRFGVDAQLHFMPHRQVDPWVGLGLAYEWLGFDATIYDGVNYYDEHYRFSGWLFPKLSVGLDVAISPVMTIGPYLSYSTGEYTDVHTSYDGGFDIHDRAFHGWLELGVRGNFNL